MLVNLIVVMVIKGSNPSNGSLDFKISASSLSFAEKLKNNGNEAYKSESYRLALSFYSKAVAELLSCGDAFKDVYYNLSDYLELRGKPQYAGLFRLLAVCFSNAAQAALQINNHVEVRLKGIWLIFAACVC